MTVDAEAIQHMRPSELARHVGMTVEELQDRSCRAFLIHPGRSKKHFEVLWRKWEKGITGLPAPVQLAVCAEGTLKAHLDQ